MPSGHPADARAGRGPNRDHGQRRLVSPRLVVERLRCEQGGGRYGETLANELEGKIPVFVISPGLVKTEMTSSFGDDLPWTPPELAPALVRVLASDRADSLAGRYIHAEHDDIEDLISRSDEIREADLNAIRLQR